MSNTRFEYKDSDDYNLRQVIYYGTDDQDTFYFTAKIGDGVAFYGMGGDDWVLRQRG